MPFAPIFKRAFSGEGALIDGDASDLARLRDDRLDARLEELSTRLNRGEAHLNELTRQVTRLEQLT